MSTLATEDVEHELVRLFGVESPPVKRVYISVNLDWDLSALTVILPGGCTLQGPMMPTLYDACAAVIDLLRKLKAYP